MSQEDDPSEGKRLVLQRRQSEFLKVRNALEEARDRFLAEVIERDAAKKVLELLRAPEPAKTAEER